MFLHENREVFNELLTNTAERFAYPEDIIEKDYFVYLLLRKINELYPDAVFKGGTSLSKCFEAINRFSEDIDLTFKREIKKSKRSKDIKHNVMEKVSEYYHFKISNFNSKEAQGDCDVPRFHFETPHIADYSVSEMKPEVTVEISYLSPCEVPVSLDVDCYISKFIREKKLEEKMDALGIDNLDCFKMNVQPLEVTFIDKVYALCDYYLEGKAEKHSRHLYDIYMISSHIAFDENFRKMAQQIRKHRSTLEKCLAASPDEKRTIEYIVKEFSSNNFYRKDYLEKTSHLIKEKNITYEMVIAKILEIAATGIF